MREIIPHVSCVVENSAEFNAAVTSGYSEIYLPQSDGFLKHSKLSHNRHVRLKVDRVPGVDPKDVRAINEEINFLPAGRIPYSYLLQVVHFFKEVMRLKKADMEAHCWILWSPEQGYFISVPKQTVSKASVNFTYEKETLPDGAVIVVDIHSHNTMGAFFSGTDDNNDKTGIYYSGVVGQLDKPVPAITFRFNMLEKKCTATLEDIFIVPNVDSVTIPKEWLEQVEVRTHQTYPINYKGGKFNYLDGYKGKGGTDSKKSLGGEQSNGHDFFSHYTGDQSSLWNDIHGGAIGHEGWQEDLELSRVEIDSAGNTKIVSITGEAFNLEDELSQQAENHIASLAEDETEPVGNGDIVVDSEEYSYYAAQFGKDTAEAKEQIEIYMQDMNGCDEGISDLIRQLYELLGEKGRTDLATNGF